MSRHSDHLDPEHPEGRKNCRACTDFKSWMMASAKSARTAPSQPSTAAQHEESEKDHACPLDKDELGRTGWSLLHSMAAYYPKHPAPEHQERTSSFLRAFSHLYPCDFCAKDMRRDLVEEPPKTESRESLSPGRLLLIDLPNSGIFGRPALLLKSAFALQGLNKTVTVLPPLMEGEKAGEYDKGAEEEIAFPQVQLALGPRLSCPPQTATPNLIVITLPSNKTTISWNSSPDRCVVTAAREVIRQGTAWLEQTEELNFLDEGTLPGLDVDAGSALSSLSAIRRRLDARWDCRACLRFSEHLAAVHGRAQLRRRHDQLAFLLSPANLTLLPAYQSKLRVLKRLGYVDEGGMVELKGKVACEVHQAELLITELMVENALSPLSVPQIAALLAATTSQFRADNDIQLSPDLAVLREKALEVAHRICKVQLEENVGDNDVVEELQFGLTEVVAAWASGVPFARIMDLTNAQEGIIVRCIQRLNEVALDVKKGAKIVGDPVLASKIEEVSAAIKRDIVFAASLYTTLT